jgi:hypothetical protein
MGTMSPCGDDMLRERRLDQASAGDGGETALGFGKGKGCD